ncbi:MAG: aldo/keto reductase [Oscillibacter sp.]|nr:aldo/keto reductase [Oscillibacter sp.]
MIYRDFQGKKLSLLGFGTMRLPLCADGSIDETQVREMTRLAMESGVNYFDTAWPYHSGESETVMGRVLKDYPRDSFYLATKYPGHQIVDRHDPAAIFEKQLEKCGVDHFDFYLLHNVNENSIKDYMDPRWGILDYFREQKRLGRIRHLGFSTHGSVAMMKEFLDYCGKDMEFCQIQLNYLDWTLQDAKGKCGLLAAHNIPIWVMEPVRGGKLASLNDAYTAKLKALRPEESIPAWCFRFLQSLPNITMILSGMSNLEQMQDNLKTFREEKPTTAEETALLLEIAEELKNAVPCTACRYCCDGCPAGLDIPALLSLYNDLRYQSSVIASMRVEALPVEKRPSACVGCGQCSAICPQQIDIPAALSDFTARFAALPSWAEICRQRAAAQSK